MDSDPIAPRMCGFTSLSGPWRSDPLSVILLTIVVVSSVCTALHLVPIVSQIQNGLMEEHNESGENK